MTNPAQAMRLLLTYAVCIPLAVLIGYLLTNPLDYGTLGFIGLLLLLLASPIFIKWHYPLMVFALGSPIVCFFLMGSPPLSQVMVFLSLGIAIVNRTINSEKQFISVPVMIWPLLFILGIVIMTAKLTGGIGFHSVGGEMGGGKKYLAVFAGIATYFALVSHKIPRERWRAYLILFMLTGAIGVFGDIIARLPSPLNYLNLLIPPQTAFNQGLQDVGPAINRFRAVTSLGIVPIYLLARYGLRGVFLSSKFWRPAVFMVCFGLQMLGGYRSVVVEFVLLCLLMLFLEGLHRTRLIALLALASVVGVVLLAVFSEQMPLSIQRSLCFLPFKWDSEAVMDAQASSDWRHGIWQAVWPQVPQYLLLGKGYALSVEDYQNIGQGAFASLSASHIDASEETLAISSDFHSGPLSTLMAFGLWGGIGIVWLMAAALFVIYRNYLYGDPELKIFNTYMFAYCILCIFTFFFIFGAFPGDVGNYAKMAGFSIAMNWGVAKPAPKTASNPLIKPAKPLPAESPQLA